ncbi:hypothetical protein K466DRAFT_607725 [Polyporus arcularius HHB13444]|uniref:Uncharacterized protein n=1 Tax=Polyporus arcularius HHB13444 TaxID=1314778 RepID=A0A5C3NM75_9APHY|nr:hypothetical protein K466DRAFT_607725 [Polyporus arcularius HHB13444]
MPVSAAPLVQTPFVAPEDSVATQAGVLTHLPASTPVAEVAAPSQAPEPVRAPSTELPVPPPSTPPCPTPDADVVITRTGRVSRAPAKPDATPEKAAQPRPKPKARPVKTNSDLLGAGGSKAPAAKRHKSS